MTTQTLPIDQSSDVNAKPKIIGLLQQTLSNISLEKTEYLDAETALKEMVSRIDPNFFDVFETTVKNSPAKSVATYFFTQHRTSEGAVLAEASVYNIYEEFDLAHIYQICKKCATKNNSAFVLTRGKDKELYVVYIQFNYTVGSMALKRHKHIPTNNWIGVEWFLKNY